METTLGLGKNKRLLAGDLTTRLRKRFADNGLLHTGQGKWYPGESLPRWALTCYWRKDGQPIWHDSKLLADDRTNYSHDQHPDAKTFRRCFGGTKLEVPDLWSIAGYEDVWHHLWKEGRLPISGRRPAEIEARIAGGAEAASEDSSCKDCWGHVAWPRWCAAESEGDGGRDSLGEPAAAIPKRCECI